MMPLKTLLPRSIASWKRVFRPSMLPAWSLTGVFLPSPWRTYLPTFASIPDGLASMSRYWIASDGIHSVSAKSWFFIQ